MYLYGEFHTPSAEELVNLIEKGDGVIIKDLEDLKSKKGKKNVHIICDIYVQNSFETGANLIRKFKPFLASDWVMDSICHWSIQETNQYIAFE